MIRLVVAMLLAVSIGLLFAEPAFASFNGEGSNTVFGICKSSNSANPTASNTPVCKEVGGQDSKNNNVFILIIKEVINVIAFIVGVASVIIIIISGFKMAAAGGDTKAVTEARNGILGAILGIVVVALAETFVVFVLNRIK